MAKEKQAGRLLAVAASEYGDTIQYFLKDVELVTFVVTRADQLVEGLKKARPDILVVDCVTPQMNGFAVFRWLRLEGGCADVPALLITMGRNHHRIREDEATAPVDFIDVPMRQSDFLEKSKALYSQRGSPQAVKQAQSVAAAAATQAPRGQIESGQVVLNANAIGKTIMIVEDDPDHAALVKQLLEKEGYRVIESNNLDAFKTAVLHKPEMILMDLMMPVVDGFALAEVFRACRLTRHVPIVFLTALHETQYVEASKGLQAAAYLTKPVRKSNFLFTINMVMTNKNKRM